ncbi:MAG: hypothetical protein ACI4T9_02660 [Prevotella sp.]
MNTSNFNTHRFTNVLLWETMLNKRKLATWALIFFGLIAIPQLIGLILARNNNTIDVTSTIAGLIFMAYLVAGVANIFTNIKTKQERINEFTLPASNLEKFVARYLQTVVGMSLAAIIGFLAGDLLQYLLTAIIGQGQQGWASALFFNFNNSFVGGFQLQSDLAMYTLTSILGLIALHALFLFFGSIFHKHPVGMAILSSMGLGILTTLLTVGATKILMDLSDAGYVVYVYDVWINVILIIFYLALIVFSFWFAYRKYARLQVINNRWFNK